MSETADQVDRLAALYGQPPERHSAVEFLRVAPQRVDAEQSVLGGVMLSPQTLSAVRGMLTEGDFYRTEHRLIWRAITALDDARRPFDSVTLGEWLEGEGLEEQVGGSGYLIELVSRTPSAANIAAYAEIVRDRATLRRLIDAGTALVNDAFAPGAEPATVRANAMAAIHASSPQEAARVQTVTDGLRGMVDAMSRAYEDAAPVGVSWGLPGLDEKCGRMQPGDLCLLVARPSMGKTAEAIQIAAGAGRTLFASMEMSSAKIVTRLTAHVGRFPVNWITKPLDAPDHASASVYAAAAQVKDLPLLIEDKRLSFDQLRALAMQLHAQDPLALLVVDHLGLFKRRHKDRDVIELGQITKGLKELAKELSVPVLLLAQLNRGLESRTDKRPTMADIREAGEAEEDADVIVALYRDDYYDPSSYAKGTAEFIVRKARDGELGTVYARADLPRMRFEECDEPARPVAETGGHSRGKSYGSRFKSRQVSGDSRDDG